MKTTFASALLRSFQHAASVMGTSVLLNGESVQATVSEADYVATSEEGGVLVESELMITLSQKDFSEFGKTGDPRRNVFVIDSVKYRAVKKQSVSESPIVQFSLRKDV